MQEAWYAKCIGARDAPPRGPNSFIFMQFAAKKLQSNRLVTHFGSWRPIRKILDPPLCCGTSNIVDSGQRINIYSLLFTERNANTIKFEFLQFKLYQTKRIWQKKEVPSITPAFWCWLLLWPSGWKRSLSRGSRPGKTPATLDKRAVRILLECILI